MTTYCVEIVAERSVISEWPSDRDVTSDTVDEEEIQGSWGTGAAEAHNVVGSLQTQ